MSSDNWHQWFPWKKSVQKTLEAAQRAELDTRGVGSVAEAFEEAGEGFEFCGVLDLYALSKRKTAGKCLELSATACKRHFGATKPTRAQIEAALPKLIDSLGRGESVCVVAWAKGAPKEMLFTGWSVD